MLENHHLSFTDKQLSWGATWARYHDTIREQSNADVIWVGIELGNPEIKPTGAIDINHHDERSNWPSSIEQVAGLLGIELNRYQQLVAANDKGYIPALEAAGASTEEIASIRMADRSAQGVTAEDERLAEESIKKELSIINGLHLVKSHTNKFSPITDRLYGQYQSLLIYNEKKAVFYGKGVDKLISCFTQLHQNGICYSGGGNNGFWGVAEGKLSALEIENLVNDIIQLKTDD
jgi:hypothetical protein